LRFVQAELRRCVAGLANELVSGFVGEVVRRQLQFDISARLNGRDVVLLRQAGQYGRKVLTDNWRKVGSWASGRHCLKFMYIHITPYFAFMAA